MLNIHMYQKKVFMLAIPLFHHFHFFLGVSVMSKINLVKKSKSKSVKQLVWADHVLFQKLYIGFAEYVTIVTIQQYFYIQC